MRDTFSIKLFTARKLAGMTLETLSHLTQISKQTLSKYENAQVTPNGESIIKLCRALNVKADYLVSEKVSGFDLDSLKFRDVFKLDGHEVNRIKLNTLIKIENYLQLEKLANEIIEFNNPIDNLIIKNEDDAKKAAKTLRKKWKIGNEPIRNVIDTLESNGIKIIELEFTSSFEGLSGKFQNIPVVVINSSIKEITRRRFTVLHELGHLILNIDESIFEDYQTIEYICNAFAGAILLPEDIMVKEFKNRSKITFAELFELKRQYGASVQAILLRAANMKLIGWDKYREWKETGENYNVAQYDIDEKSSRLIRLISKCLCENRNITIEKAAYLSGYDVDELENKISYIDL